METFGLLLGGCCVIPLWVLGSLLVLKICQTHKCSGRRTLFILFLVWLPVFVAIAAELHYMWVEEPRAQQGLD